MDWDKWVDEDDEEEAGAGGDMGGFDMSMLQNFQVGFGGACAPWQAARSPAPAAGARAVDDVPARRC